MSGSSGKHRLPREGDRQLPQGFAHIECDAPYCSVFLDTRLVRFKLMYHAPVAEFIEGHDTLVIAYGNRRRLNESTARDEYFTADKLTGNRSHLLQRVMHHLLVANMLKDGHDAFVYALVPSTLNRQDDLVPSIRQPLAEAGIGKRWRLLAMVEKT